MNRRAELIRNHAAAVARSVARYRRENHCTCGEWLAFSVYKRARLCDQCRMKEGATA